MVRYSVELARELAERDDVDLHVLASTEAAQYFSRQNNVVVHRAPSVPTPIRSLLEWTGHIGTLREEFDVIHGTKHLLPRIRTRATKVLTVHDMLALDRPEDYPFMKRKLLQVPYSESIRESDLVVCVSEATKKRLGHYAPEAASSAAVVPLAPSNTLVNATPMEVPALAGQRFALVVGDAGARKNLSLVVNVWPRVRSIVPGAVLGVVGPRGWGANERGSLWDEQVRSGAICSLGYVDDRSLRWCYEHAAVVLCPSLVEGFGLPAAEATAFGAPLITSTDAALREASGGRAKAISVDRPDRWACEIAEALKNPRRLAIPPGRDWGDVTEETVVAIRGYRNQLAL
jgi:glycosyltransferase involved in cell wall biosynthesis